MFDEINCIFECGAVPKVQTCVNLVDFVKSFPTSAALGRRKKASSGDQGTQKQKKARVAPKGK